MPSPESPLPASFARRWMRSVSRGWRIIRTGLGFAALGILSLLLATTAMPIIHLLPGCRQSKEAHSQRALHRVVRSYLRLLRALRIMKFRCTGQEKLRKSGQLVIANHPTLLDALLLMSLMPETDCVVAERWFDHPFLGLTVRGAGYIPNCDGPKLVEECAERLRSGRSLIFFPEGTRSPKNGLGTFARGAAHIALRAGCDLVPVTLTCAPATLYRGEAWWDVPDRRFEMTLHVGDPLVLKEIIDEPMSRSRAARKITATLRDYYERQLSIV